MRGRTVVSSGELARVLSHYDLGIIYDVVALEGGRRRAPKLVITAQAGKFLLKRRPASKTTVGRVSLAHAVQTYLAGKSFPVSVLVKTRGAEATYLNLDRFLYELFGFVEGTRYNGSEAATVDAGLRLAQFHRHLGSFTHKGRFPVTSFHGSGLVRRHLKSIGSRPSDAGLAQVAEDLMLLYNASSVQVSELGFDAWTKQIVHGDWHPGNLLYCDDRVVAALDFDSLRIAPTWVDLANGMLQFSIVAGRPDPAAWPDHLDRARLLQFVAGYIAVTPLVTEVIEALPDLMVETMIAEAVLPVAVTGTFGQASGLEFLQMILRKVRWLKANRDALIRAFKCQRPAQVEGLVEPAGALAPKAAS